MNTFRMPYVIHAVNVNEALPRALELIKRYGQTVVSRGRETLEYPGPVITHYVIPDENVLFCPVRNANPFFHFFESLWILAGSNRVEMPAYFLKSITDYSDDGKTFHGAYGYRLHEQLHKAVDILREKPDSRQVVLSIWNADKDLGTQSKDIPCNDLIMFKVRHDRLHMTVCNRSNDAIWGAYGANAVQFSFIMAWVAAMVGVGIGSYCQMSDSLHVYTDLPLWKDYVSGKWKPQDYLVIDPYREIAESDGDHECALPLHGREEAELLMQDAKDLCSLFEANVSLGGLLAGPVVWKSHLMRTTGRPMLVAYANHKNGNTKAGIEAAKLIRAADWRRACVAWLERRLPEPDFLAGVKACDLSGDGTCEACQ
jgi:hypothetical protein